ncbi:hypothetical protein GOP47_0015890, partial [Adiantum capillus-veneris]
LTATNVPTWGEVSMRRTAQCRWLWWLRCCSVRITGVHFSCFNSSRREATQLDFPTAAHQELFLGSTTSRPQSTDMLRRKNCWKLWKYRRLSVEHISFVLQMGQDTVISNILDFERTVDRVDWCSLSKLVGLTTATTQAIFTGTMRANMKLCSSINAKDLFTSDNRRLGFQSVTHLQINLVHAMLERGLNASEILHLASLTVEDEDDVEKTIHTVLASPLAREKASSAAFSECCRDKERLSSVKSEEGKEDADCRDSTYAHEGVEGQKTEALGDSLGPSTNIPRPKISTMFDLIQWLRKNQMVVCAFTYCESQHMLLLLLELLEGTTMFVEDPLVKSASGGMADRYLESLEGTTTFVKASLVENTADGMTDRSKMFGRSSVQACHLASRMHRALCLKPVILGVLIHVPQRSVEFIVRIAKKPFHTSSNVYHVHISSSPSCTCPDFACSTRLGYDYRPCKHLFYIYMVHLSIGKDLEHLMFQGELMEDDLERILDGYYY